MASKFDPNREISIEELESTYLKYVGNQLDCLLGCLLSDQYQHHDRAMSMVQNMVNTRDKIEGLRKKAIAGKLNLGEVIQHIKSDKKKRKPRRRKVLTRFQRVIKNFL